MSDYCVAVQICRRMVYLFGTWFCESMCYLEQISYYLYSVIIWTFTIDISYCMSNVSIHIYLRQLLTEIYFSPTKIYRIFVHVFMSIPDLHVHTVGLFELTLQGLTVHQGHLIKFLGLSLELLYLDKILACRTIRAEPSR